MMDWLISLILRLWDAIRGRHEESIEYDEKAAQERAQADPAVRKYVDEHKISVPVEERKCACGCGTVMRVPLGSTQYTIRAHRKYFRDRARKADLLKFRFAHNRPQVEKASLT